MVDCLLNVTYPCAIQFGDQVGLREVFRIGESRENIVTDLVIHSFAGILYYPTDISHNRLKYQLTRYYIISNN